MIAWPKEPSFIEICRAISTERLAQDKQWGGAEHDDQHRSADWATYVSKQTKPIREMSSFSPASAEEFEERMVKVAALAIAAIQSNCRRLHKHFPNLEEELKMREKTGA